MMADYPWVEARKAEYRAAVAAEAAAARAAKAARRQAVLLTVALIVFSGLFGAGVVGLERDAAARGAHGAPADVYRQSADVQLRWGH